MDWTPNSHPRTIGLETQIRGLSYQSNEWPSENVSQKGIFLTKIRNIW